MIGLLTKYWPYSDGSILSSIDAVMYSETLIVLKIHQVPEHPSHLDQSHGQTFFQTLDSHLGQVYNERVPLKDKVAEGVCMQVLFLQQKLLAFINQLM